MLSNEEIIKIVKSFQTPRRFLHTQQVAKLAVDFAKTNNVNLYFAWLAAMLHDIAKEFDQQKIKFLVKEKIQQFPTINAAHGLAGAIFVCNELNIKNKQIFNAIANHVIPSEKCSKLSMIIYCADKLDPNKSKLRIEQKIELTKLAKRDIKKAYLVIKNIFRNNFF